MRPRLPSTVLLLTIGLLALQSSVASGSQGGFRGRGNNTAFARRSAEKANIAHSLGASLEYMTVLEYRRNASVNATGTDSCDRHRMDAGNATGSSTANIAAATAAAALTAQVPLSRAPITVAVDMGASPPSVAAPPSALQQQRQQQRLPAAEAQGSDCLSSLLGLAASQLPSLDLGSAEFLRGFAVSGWQDAFASHAAGGAAVKLVSALLASKLLVAML